MPPSDSLSLRLSRITVLTGVSYNATPCQVLFFHTPACTQRRAPFRSHGNKCHTNQGSLVINFRSGISIRPMHLFGHNFDHDYYFELLVKRSGPPNQFLGVYCTPSSVPSWPACEPNFTTCS